MSLTMVKTLEAVAILLPVDEVETLAFFHVKLIAELPLREHEVPGEAHGRDTRLFDLSRSTASGSTAARRTADRDGTRTTEDRHRRTRTAAPFVEQEGNR